MPLPLNEFRTKLAEIATEYESLHLRCVDLESEVLTLREGWSAAFDVPVTIRNVQGCHNSKGTKPSQAELQPQTPTVNRELGPVRANGELKDLSPESKAAAKDDIPVRANGELKDLSPESKAAAKDDITQQLLQVPERKTVSIFIEPQDQLRKLSNEQTSSTAPQQTSLVAPVAGNLRPADPRTGGAPPPLQDGAMQHLSIQEPSVVMAGGGKYVSEQCIISELNKFTRRLSLVSLGSMDRGDTPGTTKPTTRQSREDRKDGGDPETEIEDGYDWKTETWHTFIEGLLHPHYREFEVDPVWDSNFQARKSAADELAIGSHLMIKRLTTTITAKLSRLQSTEALIESSRSCMSCLRFKNHAILHPNSAKKLIWDIMSLTLVFYDFVMLPMGVFDTSEDLEIGSDAKLWLAAYWSVDILVSFLTGYYTAGGRVEMHLCKIAKHYLRTYFPIDISITVLDWLLIGLTMTSNFSGAVRMMFRGARGLRLLRIRKGLQRMSMLTENICTEYIHVAMDVYKFMMCVFLASHYTACCWYGLSNAELGPNWADVALAGEHEFNTGYAYTTSLHWALTQFTPASMEVVPQNVAERAFACATIMTAMVVFSSFVSAITQAMTHLRHINQEKMLQECTIRRFLKQRNISNDTSVQVWRFVKSHKLTESSLVKEADIPIFKQLPTHIKNQLRQQAHIPHISVHPLFLLLDKCEDHMMSILCTRALRDVLIGSGAELYAAEEEIHDMFFVVHGVVGYNSSAESDTIYVKPQNWACELVLWANYVRLQGSMLAYERGAELVLLNSTAFRKVARRHCSSFSFLADYAATFVIQFRQAQLAKQDLDTDSVMDDSLSDEEAFIPEALRSPAEILAQCVLFNDWSIADDIVAEVAEAHPLHCMMYRKLRTKLGDKKGRTLFQRVQAATRLTVPPDKRSVIDK